MTEEYKLPQPNRIIEWLDENVIVPPQPKTVSVSNIQFDWTSLSGKLSVSLDGVMLADQFRVSVEIDGRARVRPPMFHSPLGVPASYAAINLDDKTEASIQRLIENIFPKMRAFGWHKDISCMVDCWTAPAVRIIDLADFEKKKQEIERSDLVVTGTV